jgi:undecaprenyl-diphosphatase
MLDSLIHTDQQLLLWLNGHHSPFFDSLMFSFTAKFTWVPLYVLLLFFIIRQYRWKAVWIILAIVVMITMTDQVCNILKNSVKRPRPCHEPAIATMVHLVNNKCGGAYGFVSAHAANTFALAVFVSLMYARKWITSVMLAWASLVSYSRIYLGSHYPGDVLTGALIGVLVAFLVYAVVNRYFPGKIFSSGQGSFQTDPSAAHDFQHRS